MGEEGDDESEDYESVFSTEVEESENEEEEIESGEEMGENDEEMETGPTTPTTPRVRLPITPPAFRLSHPPAPPSRHQRHLARRLALATAMTKQPHSFNRLRDRSSFLPLRAFHHSSFALRPFDVPSSPIDDLPLPTPIITPSTSSTPFLRLGLEEGSAARLLPPIGPVLDPLMKFNVDPEEEGTGRWGIVDWRKLDGLEKAREEERRFRERGARVVLVQVEVKKEKEKEKERGKEE